MVGHKAALLHPVYYPARVSVPANISVELWPCSRVISQPAAGTSLAVGSGHPRVLPVFAFPP